MARPTKQGIDFFPVDCEFDDKTQMYLIEKGGIGLSVLISVWQMIYSNEGYFIVNNMDLHLLIKRRIDVDINEVSDCINVCLRRNLFCTDLHKKYSILTSAGIQRRFFMAASKKKSVQIVSKYVLGGVNACGNWVNADGNATKGKEEVKVKEKVKEDIGGRPPDCPHQEIIKIYHKILPMCPRVSQWTETRAKLLKSRWAELAQRQDPEWWAAFFRHISESIFLTGNAPGRDGQRPFVADLEWILKLNNFVKIIEGKYHSEVKTG